MIDPITASANATATQQAQGLTGAAKSLGKDDFLRLLVAQLQNQDPLKPQDNSTFVAELAQFSSLEQTVAINERLDTLALQNQGLQNSNIVDMVGAMATMRGGTITAEGSGQPVPFGFELAGEAHTVKVTISDFSGNPVRTINVGSRAAGKVTLNWDGKNDQGIVQPKGPYTVSVTATDADGATVDVDQETRGLITAVSFDKGYPVLHLQNGMNAPVGDLLKLER